MVDGVNSCVMLLVLLTRSKFCFSLCDLPPINDLLLAFWRMFRFMFLLLELSVVCYLKGGFT